MAQQKLNARVQIGSVLERSVKKNIGVLRSGLEGVGKEIKVVTDRQRELSKQRRILEKQGRSVEALDREYEDLGRTLDRLRGKQARWTRAAQASQRVGNDFRTMTREVGRVARSTAIGIGAAGAAVVGIARGTAEAAREVEQMSAMANANTTEFQRMAIAAESVGIEQDKLGDILKDVNDRVGDFLETGGGPMADFFENIAPKVGVTIDQFKELSGPEALQLYVSSLEKAGVSQQQMTFYMEAMASDSTALVPLLKNNGEELKRLGDNGEKTGRVLDRITIKSAAEFRASLTELKGGLTGVRNTLGKEFMPVVGDVMSRFNVYLRDNQDEVKRFAVAAGDKLEKVVPIIGEVASGMGKVGGKVGEVITEVSDMVGGWENFGVIIGGAVLAKTLSSVGKMIASVARFGGAIVGVIGSIGGIGTAMNTAATTTGKAVGRMNRSLARLTISGSLAAVQGFLALNGAPENPEELADWQKKNREGMDSSLRATPGVGTAMRGYDWLYEKWHGTTAPKAGAVIETGKVGLGPRLSTLGSSDRPFPKNHPMHQAQKRATGGTFRPGWRMVGEQGRELEFVNRSGFIATNRATERMAGFAKSARADMARATQSIADARIASVAESARADMGSALAGASGGSAAASITNHIQINAAGMSPQALIDELERRMRDASAGALYDGARGYGQYGGVA
ncbi:hypothetical protein T8A63_15325 [Sulfitobacter sp. OXR-159]|uniref:hypothetical protein n=1 Tax=Sulfitobacter sp. OXR-159 TaxID=3100174 RepID=UPI002AC98947|nr:hypothetical protein [Sulfitobacter sp. OXR-159]WPZ28985.1 hypothetical protein T8A63_15325 [Sulfitobacter sp. OXR-159]